MFLRKNKLVNSDGVLDETLLKQFEIESLTPEERNVLFKVLAEYASDGKSDLLELLWRQDYDEIPVDIEKFICDNDYLGKSTNQGRAIYPFWVDVLKTIYDPNAKYFEVILSGAIGIGKTTISVIGISYMLHKLMCLQDPATYYELTPGSKIIVAFFNITLDLSRGVAFNRLQEMLQLSPWFMARGSIVGQKHHVYVPSKNVDFRVGSTERHGLGQDIFCLVKGTEVVTNSGVCKIENLVDKDIMVYSYDRGNVVISDKCTVKESGITKELIEIEFDNGFSVKCTPNHQWLLNNSETYITKYVSAENIKIGDDIVSINK